MRKGIKGNVIVTAKLNNGKQVLLEPNMKKEKCQYRYLAGSELLNGKLLYNNKFVWLETPIYSTVEQGVRVVFSVIEGTPVVFSRFKA